MLQTMTAAAPAAEMCRQKIITAGIANTDALELWTYICGYAETAQRSGFKEGFEMALTLVGRQPEQMRFVPEVIPQERIQTRTETTPRNEEPFVRIEQSKTGKRLHFNQASALMLGNYEKADIYLQGGRMLIYPTNDGRYTIMRSASGHVQICCADIVDALSTNGKRFAAEKRDNHVVVRCS